MAGQIVQQTVPTETRLGPFPNRYPVFHVTAITHRKDAVYPATIVGIPPMEDFYLGGAALTRPAWPPSPIGWERGWG